MYLKDYLEDENRKCGEVGKVYHSERGGFKTVMFEDVPYYAENLTPRIVVYLAMDDKRVVGVKSFDA